MTSGSPLWGADLEHLQQAVAALLFSSHTLSLQHSALYLQKKRCYWGKQLAKWLSFLWFIQVPVCSHMLWVDNSSSQSKLKLLMLLSVENLVQLQKKRKKKKVNDAAILLILLWLVRSSSLHPRAALLYWLFIPVQISAETGNETTVSDILLSWGN